MPSGRDYIGRWEETLLAPACRCSSSRRAGRGSRSARRSRPAAPAEAELLELWLTELRPRGPSARGSSPACRPATASPCSRASGSARRRSAARSRPPTTRSARRRCRRCGAPGAADASCDADAAARPAQGRRGEDLRPSPAHRRARGGERRTPASDADAIHPELGTGRRTRSSPRSRTRWAAAPIASTVRRRCCSGRAAGLRSATREPRRELAEEVIPALGVAIDRSPPSPLWRSRTIVPAPSATNSTSTVLARAASGRRRLPAPRQDDAVGRIDLEERTVAMSVPL
jgi:hypothetical protein